LEPVVTELQPQALVEVQVMTQYLAQLLLPVVAVVEHTTDKQG
jgi:hypothetical protein